MLLKLFSSIALTANILTIAAWNVVPNSLVNKNNIEIKKQDISVNIEPYEHSKKWFANHEKGSKNWTDTIKSEFILFDFKDEGLNNIEEIQEFYEEIKFDSNLIYLQTKGELVDSTTLPMFDSGLRSNVLAPTISIKDIAIKKSDNDSSPNTEVMQVEYNGSFTVSKKTASSHSMIYLEIYFKEETKLYANIITKYDITTYQSSTIWSSDETLGRIYLDAHSTSGTVQIIANK